MLVLKNQRGDGAAPSDSVAAGPISVPSVSPTATGPRTVQGIPPRKAYSHRARITEGYDDFKGVTAVTLQPFSVIVTSNQRMEKFEFGAFFTYTGSRLKEPPLLVTLWIVSTGEDWQFLKSSGLIFKAGGSRIDLGTMAHDGTVGSGYVLEQMNVTIPVETFLRIVNASDVKGQLFTTEFTLIDDDLEALRDFASRMNG